MRKFFVVVLAAAFAAAQGWAGTGNHVIYNVSSAVYNDVMHADHENSELEEEADSFLNSVTVKAGTFNAGIAGGISDNGDAYQNTINVEGGIFGSGAELKAGYSKSGDATGNTAYISNVTLQGSVMAGEGAVNAADNELTMENVIVDYNSEGNLIISGKGSSGEVSGNQLNITSGSVINTRTAAGYSDGGAAVSYNIVTVDGASRLNDNASGNNAVYGGYATQGNSFHNQITLQQAGTVEADLYGGYSDSGSAEYNLVLAQQAGDVTGAVYGGYTASGAQAYRNEVRLNNAVVSGVVAGGWAEGSGNALNNRVTVASGAALTDTAVVYGGYAAQGAVSNNTVSLASASAGAEAYGGYAAQGAANGNSLSISGATQGGNTLAGGYAATGAASNNTLSISNASLSGGNFYGGYGETGASGNGLSVVSSALSGNLYGGYVTSGSASGNNVSVSGSTVTGNIYGGYTANGEASGNTVVLNEGTVTGDVYGGYAAAAGTTEEPADTVTSNNTVVLAGNAVVNGNFYGGNGTAASGNTLLLRNYTGSINAINAFDNVTIYGLNSDVTFNAEVPGGVNVELYGRPSELAQTLAHTQTGTTLTLNRDALGAYAYSIEGTPSGGYTDWSVRGRYENTLAKPYAQAQLAGLALAGLGDEMLHDAFNEAIKLKTENDSFGGVQYYDNSYDTGSSFDMQSLVVQGGHWYKTGENVWGWLLQYAHGHYSTRSHRRYGRYRHVRPGRFCPASLQ